MRGSTKRRNKRPTTARARALKGHPFLRRYVTSSQIGVKVQQLSPEMLDARPFTIEFHRQRHDYDAVRLHILLDDLGNEIAEVAPLDHAEGSVPPGWPVSTEISRQDDMDKVRYVLERSYVGERWIKTADGRSFPEPAVWTVTLHEIPKEISTTDYIAQVVAELV